MLWENFILVIALLGCIALAMSRFDFGRPSLTLRGAEQAEAKGMQLLLDNLSPEQRHQYQAFGYFHVVGSKTGTVYRIHHGTSRNVRELENDDIGTGRCFTPKGELVAGDCMLAQKIALENCEEDVLRTALPF